MKKGCLDGIISGGEPNVLSGVYKGADKFVKKAEVSGFKYSNIISDASGVSLILGDHDGENGLYHHIRMEQIKYCDKKLTAKVYVGSINSSDDADLEKIIKSKAYTKGIGATVTINPKKTLGFLVDTYNSAIRAENDSLPKIKAHDMSTLAAYAFAGGYGATVMSWLDNSPVASTHSYGIWRFGVLAVGALIPMAMNKRLRSVQSLAGLGLIAWAANSFFYYPIGMLMGHTSTNPADIINFYKFQVGMGQGYYFDHYGPAAVKVTSKVKAVSYAGKVGLAGVFAKWNSMAMKRKSKRDSS